MSKNKKGKVVPIKSTQFSPDGYIKTQARSLPIMECLVTKGWEDSGMCNIFVARMHKTGNVTIGIYLVDTYCLGLKDTQYQFNIPLDEYGFLKATAPDVEECDYTLAHNIIYGSIAYAGDYGFKASKDFSITQFILEEDDENIALMELAFGFEGKPCYMPGPYDDERTIINIIATLERTAGKDNYTVLDPDDDWDFDDDDPEFDEDEELDEDDLIQDLEETYAKFPRILKKINKIYDEKIRTASAKEMLKKSTIGKAYKVSRGRVKNEYTSFDTAEQENEYDTLKQLVIDGDDYDSAIKNIKKAIKKYPHKPAFYDLLMPAYNFGKKYDEQDELVMEMYQLFPDYLYPKIAYVNLLMDKGKPEQVLAVFNEKTDLNYLYPDRKMFYVTEAADYYASMCRCYLMMEEIDSADLYMDALFKKKLTDVPGGGLVSNAIQFMCEVKMEIIMPAKKSGEE